MAIKTEHAGAKNSGRKGGKREGRFSDDASGEMEAEAALHRAMEGRDMSTEELVAALRGY